VWKQRSASGETGVGVGVCDQHLGEFAYDSYLRQYGLPSMAKTKFAHFLRQIKIASRQSRLLLHFYHFVGEMM
jgi:hypothetical protein